MASPAHLALLSWSPLRPLLVHVRTIPPLEAAPVDVRAEASALDLRQDGEATPALTDR